MSGLDGMTIAEAHKAEQTAPENARQKEDVRLGALRELEILDTPGEPAFDRITRIARNIFGVPMAAISFVDKDRQWFKSRPGLKDTETPRSYSFCTHTIEGQDVFVVPDAPADAQFCSSPLVCGGPQIHFYAGAPLRTREGFNLGALCLMDTTARPDLDDRQRAILIDLAEMVVEECISRRREHELCAAKDAAESANGAKGEFLSRVSHELRTPMNAILGFTQLLEMDELSEIQRSNVARIMRSAKHLLNLLNEILQISRIEAGRLAVELEPVKIADGIREASEFVQPMLAERGIGLRIEKPAFAASTVLADQQKMIQVFLNLLSNAIKYNREKGEIAVTIEIVDRTDVRVNVTDTGEGISPESLLKLFQPFERLGADRTKTPGTGLALSKKMVELMGGSIGVTSVVGQGSTFWVQFPLYNPQTGPEPEAAVESKQAAGRTVLYIEDALLSIHLIKGILKRATPNGNVRVISAIQGNLGLEMAQIHTPDLILLDLHLPDLSGIQVLNRLKEDARTSSIPVIVLTADALPGTRGQVLEAGALDCLLKPVNVSQFLDTVRPILEVSTT